MKIAPQNAGSMHHKMLVHVSPQYFCYNCIWIIVFCLETANIMYFQEYPPFIGLFFLVFEIYSDKCQFGAVMKCSCFVRASGWEQQFLKSYKNWSRFLDKVPGLTLKLKITTILTPMDTVSNPQKLKTWCTSISCYIPLQF